MSRLLLVNYHYIRDPAQYRHPGIHPLSPVDFEKQVEQLQERFGFPTPDEVEAFVTGKGDLPDPSVLLTFDDGLTDHGWAAREVLEPRGIKGVFFVCSRPLMERRVLMVHKLHYLRATTPPDEFAQRFMALLPKQWREHDIAEEETDKAGRIYIYDEPDVARLKYFINFVIPGQVVDQTCSRVFDEADLDEEELCRWTYMDTAALRGLAEAGHLIGAHTHDHWAITRLGATDQAEDITRNKSALQDATGRRPTWFSYPYGRDWALPEDTIAFCREHGFSVGVALTGTWVKPEDLPGRLSRINTNEVSMVIDELETAG